jgi:CubicO group peptidase (beta-lactamase class C family)
VKGLHPQIGETTVSQLLSHSAGIDTRREASDGADPAQVEPAAA